MPCARQQGHTRLTDDSPSRPVPTGNLNRTRCLPLIHKYDAKTSNDEQKKDNQGAQQTPRAHTQQTVPRTHTREGEHRQTTPRAQTQQTAPRTRTRAGRRGQTLHRTRTHRQTLYQRTHAQADESATMWPTPRHLLRPEPCLLHAHTRKRCHAGTHGQAKPARLR